MLSFKETQVCNQIIKLKLKNYYEIHLNMCLNIFILEIFTSYFKTEIFSKEYDTIKEKRKMHYYFVLFKKQILFH